MEPQPIPCASEQLEGIRQRLRETGYLKPTEPDEDEQAAVMRELKAAIAELEMLEVRSCPYRTSGICSPCGACLGLSRGIGSEVALVRPSVEVRASAGKNPRGISSRMTER